MHVAQPTVAIDPSIRVGRRRSPWSSVATTAAPSTPAKVASIAPSNPNASSTIAPPMLPTARALALAAENNAKALPRSASRLRRGPLLGPGQAPKIWSETERVRGPSNSARMILCHVPRTS